MRSISNGFFHTPLSGLLDALVEAAPTKVTVKTKGGVVGRGRAKKKLSMGRGQLSNIVYFIDIRNKSSHFI